MADLPTWHDTRAGIVTGSQTATIAGLSKFSTPWQWHMQQLGRIADVKESEAMTWGTLHEPAIRSRVTTLLQPSGGIVLPWPDHVAVLTIALPDGVQLVETTTQPVLVSESLGIGGTPDGVVNVADDFGVLETKTVGERAFQQWEREDSPPPFDGLPGATRILPDSYMMQVQTYMGLTGLRWALVAVLVGGNRLECHKVEFNPTWFDGLCGMARLALQALRDGVEPPFDPYADGAYAGQWAVGMTLRKEVVTVDDPEVVRLAKRHAALSKACSRLEAHKGATAALLLRELAQRGIGRGIVEGVGKVGVVAIAAKPERTVTHKASPASSYARVWAKTDAVTDELIAAEGGAMLALPVPGGDEE